jgi:hypothetical protein
VSDPISRWLTIEPLSSCRYSIGQGRALAGAGGAGDEDDAALLFGQLGYHRRQPELVYRADFEGDRAADDRDRAALFEGVDPEPREAGDRVGEVGLPRFLELRLRPHLGDVVEGFLRFLGGQLGVALERRQLAMQAHGRGHPDLDVQVGAASLDESSQR